MTTRRPHLAPVVLTGLTPTTITVKDKDQHQVMIRCIERGCAKGQVCTVISILILDQFLHDLKNVLRWLVVVRCSSLLANRFQKDWHHGNTVGTKCFVSLAHHHALLGKQQEHRHRRRRSIRMLPILLSRGLKRFSVSNQRKAHLLRMHAASKHPHTFLSGSLSLRQAVLHKRKNGEHFPFNPFPLSFLF